MPTNGWDVFKTFLCCSFLIILLVIILANVNQPKCSVTSSPRILTSINDIVESKMYESRLKKCPTVVTEYATYLNTAQIQFYLGSPCPDPMMGVEKAVDDWTACYPPGGLPPAPQQLLTDLGECGLTVTAAAPWTLVPKSSSTPQTAGPTPPQPTPSAAAPLMSSSSYMPEITFMVT